MTTSFERAMRNQIKLFSASSLEGLESEVNGFLSNFPQTQILKVDVSVSNSSSSVSTTYIATILYNVPFTK